MFKILVPIKRVADYQAKLKLNAEATAISTEGVKFIVNPFDEIAVEEALRIQEAGGAEVVVVSIGPEATAEQIRSALAMGADRGILVKTEHFVDSSMAAEILAEIFRRESPQLVIMGKQAIDSDANQTAQLLANSLALPQATFASKVVLNAQRTAAEVTREVDGGLETIRISLPGIVSTDLRLNEPRYTSLPGIVKAKKKPLLELSLAELNIEAQPKVVVRSLSLPPKRAAGKKVSSVAELVEKLQNEAKVL